VEVDEEEEVEEDEEERRKMVKGIVVACSWLWWSSRDVGEGEKGKGGERKVSLPSS
jgi:hypothetical protein